MVQAATIENRPPKGASIAVPQTNLKAFATANRLKGYRLDECDDPEIVGRFGHLFEWSPSIWGVCLEGAGTKALSVNNVAALDIFGSSSHNKVGRCG